jgi:hypothetical protein
LFELVDAVLDLAATVQSVGKQGMHFVRFRNVRSGD